MTGYAVRREVIGPARLWVTGGFDQWRKWARTITGFSKTASRYRCGPCARASRGSDRAASACVLPMASLHALGLVFFPPNGKSLGVIGAATPSDAPPVGELRCVALR